MIATLCLIATLATGPQDAPASTGWKTPPADVVATMEAAPPPAVLPSPDAAHLLLVERAAMPDLADVARPWVGLAGVRIDPATHGRHSSSFATGLELRALEGDASARVRLPEGARVADVAWSHSGRRFVFNLVQEQSADLYLVEVSLEDAELEPKLIASGLSRVFGSGFSWMPDGERLLLRLVPGDLGPAPERGPVPTGPAVQETSGQRTPVRTYQDLLSDPHDEALFEHLASSALVLVDPRDDSRRTLAPAGIHTRVSVAPGGAHVLVERLERPFSYLVPWRSFPKVVEVLGVEGGAARTIARIPTPRDVPIGGVPTGPRSHGWQESAAATLVWLEALDGGDPKREVEARDVWKALDAPFEGESRELLRTQQRAWGLTWLRDPNLVVAGDYDRDRRWVRSLLHDLSDPAADVRVLDDRSTRDRYANPGGLVLETSEHGARLVRQDGPWLYRSGSGDSPEGARPFLDRWNVETQESERLWRSEAGVYERFADFQASAAEQKPRILTVYESKTEPPNWRLRDLEAEEVEVLTDFPDPTPAMRRVHKELVTYERSDGVPLSATLYLPEDHEPGTRLPLVVWAYPLEYNDPATAGQIRGSPHRFTRVGSTSHLLLLSQGYAVLDGATMPIVGDPETMNDTFVEQIVAAAQAAIDFAVERGVAHRSRVAVGGHSYGAFMTANLLAHSDLFAAGIARSGAYNRTLTPFGFQSERRTLWESPESYARISPFFHADTLDEPILLIHGEKDSNSGTYPIQSERLFQAIQGNGGTARLVMLPHEDHGYRGRESALHVTAEMIEWLDRHVKLAPMRAVEAGFEGGER